MPNSNFHARNSSIISALLWIMLFAAMSFLYGCSGKEPGPSQSTAAGEAEASGNPDVTPSEGSSDNNYTEKTEGNEPQPGAEAAPKPIILPGGRNLSVRLLESISSKDAKAGQSFDAELAASVVVDGETILPKRASVRVRVVSARPSGRLKNPGYLRLTLDSVQTPEGNWVDVKTTSLWEQGKSHKDRNVALIGGGTGVGAVIGAIAGGGKGAAIGAAAGAGAGTAGAYATGRKDVAFAAERRLTFATVKEVRIR